MREDQRGQSDARHCPARLNRACVHPAVGLGLRTANAAALLALPDSGCTLLEVHSENYFHAGGEPAELLRRAGARHALSLHGVGLSLGGVRALNPAHVAALVELVERVQPVLVSEHLCWNAAPDGRHFSDLLPLPRERPTLDLLVARIQEVQERLRRPLLVEHLAAYARLAGDVIDEPEWLNEIAARSGCGLLIDLHNLAVAAHNLGFSAWGWLRRIDPRHVGQYHLAGGQRRQLGADRLWLDSHDAAPDAAVWSLFHDALECFGPHPTILEWDADLPDIAAQCALVAQARACLLRAVPPALPARSALRTPACAILDLHRLGERQSAWADALSSAQPQAAPADWSIGDKGARARFAIHRRNHQHHLLAALEAIYPVLGQLLGRECLRMLAWTHIAQRPLTTGNLLDYGGGMAELLDARTEFAAWPWLSDVARLEWVLHRVAHAPPALEPLRLSMLAGLSAEALARLVVRPIPASALLHSGWDVCAIHAAPEAPVVQRAPRPVQVLIVRPGLRTTMQLLAPGEGAWWDGLSRLDFGGAHVAALAQDPEFDLAAALARWVPVGALQRQ